MGWPTKTIIAYDNRVVGFGLARNVVGHLCNYRGDEELAVRYTVVRYDRKYYAREYFRISNVYFYTAV